MGLRVIVLISPKTVQHQFMARLNKPSLLLPTSGYKAESAWMWGLGRAQFVQQPSLLKNPRPIFQFLGALALF